MVARKLRGWIFIFIAVFFLWAPMPVFGGAPHLLMGDLTPPGGGDIPPEESVQVDAFVKSRPGDTLTESDVGCGYTDGRWWVEVGNFADPWVPGEAVDVTVRDLRTGDLYRGTVVLNGSGVQEHALTAVPGQGPGAGGDDESPEPGPEPQPEPEPEPDPEPEAQPISQGGDGDDGGSCFIRSVSGISPARAFAGAIVLVLLSGLSLLFWRRGSASDRRRPFRRHFLFVAAVSLAAAGTLMFAGTTDSICSGSATYALEAGWNGIIIPFEDTGIETAEDLAMAIPGCDAVRYWDFQEQGFIEHFKGTPGSDFSIPAGHPCFVRMNQPVSWSIAGNDLASPDFSLQPGPTTGINAIGISLGRIDIDDAEALSQAVPHCEAVWYWDGQMGGYVGHPRGTAINNFPVRPGRPYFVSVNGAGTWNQERLLNVDNDGDGLTEQQGDCNDGDPASYFGATEICDDGRDNDCDGAVDCNDWECELDQNCLPCTDVDADGYFAQSGCGTPVDCNDSDGAVNPGADEACGDGADNNCDGAVDCADSDCAGASVCDSCRDADGDGYYGRPGCGTRVDCNDGNRSIYPGASETCGDGLDQDCDGADISCFDVSESTVELTPGETVAVSLAGGTPPYSWTNSDPDVVDVSLNGSEITVTGKIGGIATVTVLDSLGNSRNLSISVLVPYTLNTVSNRVLLGPVEGAAVSAYRLSDLENPIETTTSGAAGGFELVLNGIPDDELVLVTAAGGRDLDPDDDGLMDPFPTPNQGTLHGLATAGDIRSDLVVVSALSEMAWQYTAALVGDTHPEDLKIRLGDIARALFAAPISGEEVVFADLTRFVPIFEAHRDALHFSYDDLIGSDALTGALHQGLSREEIRSRIESVINGVALKFQTAMDGRARFARVRLAPFGDGRVTASARDLAYDYDTPELDDLSAFYAKGEPLVLTAHPGDGYEVNSWAGCDTVSDDQRQCTLTVQEDTLVDVTFIRSSAPVISDRVVDLTDTLISPIDEVNYRIEADPTDTATVSKLENLAAGDVIVSRQAPYYILGVVNVVRWEGRPVWMVETESVALGDIIEQGGATLRKTLTHGDLAPEYFEPAPTVRSRTGAVSGSRSQEGPVRLIPSDNPDDDTFVLEIGSPGRSRMKSIDSEGKLGLGYTFPVAGTEITVGGELELKFEVDFGIDFGAGLKDIKIIPTAVISKELSVEFKGAIKQSDNDVLRKKLTTLHFAKQPFTIGIVPGWISYEADINLVVKPELEGTAMLRSELTEELKGGFTWSKDRGLDFVTGFNQSWNILEESLTAKLKTKVYVEVAPKAALYSVIGPEISMNAGIKFEAGAKFTSDADQISGELFALLAFFMSADLKAAVKEFDQDFLENIFKDFREILEETSTIKILSEREWPIKEWKFMLGAVGEQPSFLDLKGTSKKFLVTAENTGTLPDILGEYVITNTGNKKLQWSIVKYGNLFSEAAMIDITPWGTLEAGESVTARVLWKDGYAKSRLGVGNWGAGLRFVNIGREEYPDAQTGTTQRGITIQVTAPLDTTGLSPVIDQYPDTAPAGESFLQKGWGFTPKSRVTIHVRRPDGSVYTPEPVYTDDDGYFSDEFTTSPNRDPGPYTWWVEDVTGLVSSELTYNVTVPGSAGDLKIFQNRDAGTIGTRFYQWGAGFSPNSSVTIWVRGPSGIEGVADSADTDGRGEFEAVYRVLPDKAVGTYAWWAVDDTTGNRSGEKTYIIGTSDLPGQVSVSPSSGSWESSPQWIDVSCPNAERIYCNHIETYDGSDPDIPEPPTLEVHDIFTQEGVEYIGSEGQFAVWAEPGQHKILKVVFRGWNSNGWGPVSEAFTYEIDRSNEGGDSFTNSLGMTFVRIPAGTFMMGSPTDELGRDTDETLHQVTLTRDYYMMTTEVTQAQWEAVMGSNPSSFDSCGGNCPVENVSWNDIQDFIAAFNAMEGKTYRLPTEAEWEYAARAGTTTAFYSGGITYPRYCAPLDPNLDQIGWYCGNADSTTHPVGRKQPNDWGLHDMSGNVWEWCQDWYGSYPAGAVTDPVGPDTGSGRVVRGGSWINSAWFCRSAACDYFTPSYRNDYYGFRLALSPGQ